MSNTEEAAVNAGLIYAENLQFDNPEGGAVHDSGANSVPYSDVTQGTNGQGTASRRWSEVQGEIPQTTLQLLGPVHGNEPQEQPTHDHHNADFDL